jgi:amino-acid N-acetyltransferase
LPWPNLAVRLAQDVVNMIADNALAYKAAITNLLQTEQLPTVDLPEKLENYVVALVDGQLAGVCGIEIYGNYALLRSLAVNKAYRDKAIAGNLVSEVESMAKSKGVKAIYLLTETAQGYFSRKGYQTITRADVPAEVQQSTEFSQVCPQSAVVMMKNLNNL